MNEPNEYQEFINHLKSQRSLKNQPDSNQTKTKIPTFWIVFYSLVVFVFVLACINHHSISSTYIKTALPEGNLPTVSAAKLEQAAIDDANHAWRDFGLSPGRDGRYNPAEVVISIPHYEDLYWAERHLSQSQREAYNQTFAKCIEMWAGLRGAE